jgi:hypothetical protein
LRLLSLCNILSNERMGLSFTIAAGPRQCSHFQVRVPRDSWPRFTVSDSRLPQRGGPGPCIYIPQEQGGPHIPQALGSLFVAFVDSQGYGGGIRPRFHTGVRFCTTYIVSKRIHSKHIRCPVMAICEPHRKQLFLYCCIYSALHRNGSFLIVACVFVVSYCYRRYLATGCLPRICLRGNVFT